VFDLGFANGSSRRVCTKQEAMAADKEAAYLRTWKEIHRSYQRYGHCDDGAIASGYTESVVQNLTTRWNRLYELGGLLDKDPGFEAFVLKHISPTALTEDLQQIKVLATKSCPGKAGDLCGKLAKAAERALKP